MTSVAERLLEMQDHVAAAVSAARRRQSSEQLGAVARPGGDGHGDTIFAIDVHAEEALLAYCEQWARQVPLRLVAEGLPPGGVDFGRGAPELRVLVDPIDGTRCLMHDKRSAWCLAAAAPERGDDTLLSHAVAAAMTELPTSWQEGHHRIWATRGDGARAEHAGPGGRRRLWPRPSAAGDLLHGFATFCAFFPGIKEVLARLEERVLARHLAGRDRSAWHAVYADLYMSSGGQIAELTLGRERMVVDVRPLAYRQAGLPGFCSHAYDLCTALCASEAGCVLLAPDGAPFDAPMTVEHEVAWVGYANAELAASLQPHVHAALVELRLL